MDSDSGDDGAAGTGSQAGVGGSAGSTAGAGPDSGADMDSGADADSATDDSGEPAATVCDTEGVLRCAGGGGSSAREVCEAGQWSAAEACEDTEVCNGSTDVEPGTCTSLFELCIGRAGEAVCVGADMHFCSEDALSERVEPCGSERLCQAGLQAGTCPQCLPESFQCVGAMLQRCAPAGDAWIDHMPCASAALCNADAQACTAAACLAGDKICSGDNLQVCRADQTGFQLDEPCAAGLCDPIGDECDVCTPSTSTCNATNNGSRTCTTDGQGYTDAPCGSDRPHCVGNGTCVACTMPAHCSEPNPCRAATCNSGTGTCGSVIDNSATCTLGSGGAGVCSQGSCYQCTAGNNPCSGARPHCVSNLCRPCNGPCPVGNSCSQGSDCASGVCTGGTCRPACTGSCVVGDACSVNADCASNECTSGTCAKTCGNVTLVTQADYNANSDCTRINGNLTIAHNTQVTNPLFSRLTAITGDIGPTYTQLNTNPMTGLRLPELRTIGGSVTLTATRVASIDWPRLTSIGGSLSVIQALELTSFVTPALTSIGGSTQFTLDAELRRIDMRALRTAGSFFNIILSPKVDTAFFGAMQTVSGSVALSDLMFLSYSDVRPLWEAGNRSEPPQSIGCCISGPSVTRMNCGDITVVSPECTQ